jgi:hypothetical protein
VTRLQAALDGDLREMMRAEADAVARANTRAVGRASSGLQQELRRQVRAAGLGVGVEKAWQRATYPRGRRSMNPAALVYSKATRIHDAFMADRTVTARGGRWLAIPLDAAVARGWHQDHARSSGGRPRRWANVEAAARSLGGLAFVPLPGGRGLLVHRDPAGRSTAYFLLVRRVRLRKRLDVDGPAARWADRLPGYIVRELAREDRR